MVGLMFPTNDRALAVHRRLLAEAEAAALTQAFSLDRLKREVALLQPAIQARLQQHPWS